MALLRITESQQFRISNLSGLSALGGAIGGVIAGSLQDNRTAKFVAAYNAGTTRLSSSLVTDLQSDFTAKGTQISYLAEEFAKIKDNADDYSHIQTDKDAILSVWFGPVGYIADGVLNVPYEPWLIIHVRLLHGKTKQILSQKTYSAGYKAKLEGSVFVQCSKDSRFDTFEKLMDDFEESIKALSECEKAVVQQAVQDLI